MASPAPRAATTTAAALAILAVTAFWVWAGLDMVLEAARGPVIGSSSHRGLVMMGISAEAGTTMLAVSGWFVLTYSALALACTFAVVDRRQWGRHGMLLLAGGAALVLVPLALSGFAQDQPDAWIGLGTGMANLAIVALLLAPTTADDFDVVEGERQRLMIARTARPRRVT